MQPGPALYLTCEDDAEQLHWRQEHLCAALGVNMASLAGRLHLASLRGEIGNELATFAADGKISPTAAFRRLCDMLRVTGAKLAFLDNVAHLFAGNENDRGDVTRFVNLLNKLAGETGAAIVLLGHPNKAGDEWSGSTAWPNGVRSRIYLEHDEETDTRTLSLPKANYGQKGEVVQFRWHQWAFVRDDDLPADTRAELDQVIRANGEDAAFLRCLRTRAEQGEGREVGPSPGPNYAPSQFEGMLEAKGFRKPALKRAMDRLFATGRIRSETLRDRKANRDKIVLVEVAQPSHNAPHNARTTPSHNTAHPPAQPRTTHTPYTTYNPGAAHGSAAPDDDDLDWGDEEAAE